MNGDLAVIFDMDGVLVDSYRAHFQSWRDVAAQEGLDVTEKEFAATFGRTSREIIEMLWSEGRYTDQEILALDARKEAAFRDLIRADFPIMPGATDLVDSLSQAGWALAVGSSGPPENIELVLDRLGKRDAFGAVVTGMDVTRGKPDPQVFLIAAERLGIAPQNCAVVEDAPAGVAAAHAAGMKAIGFASTGRSRQELAEADLVIDGLVELSPEVFRRVILKA
jgi:beta-phosphoglucomutase